jgi:hypothetical protein
VHCRRNCVTLIPFDGSPVSMGMPKASVPAWRFNHDGEIYMQAAE